MNQQFPTLLLDGIWGRPARFEGLLEMLRNRCGPAEVFHYQSSGLVPFETLGEQLVQEIRRLDGPVNLIGFSMGGLVIRAAHLLDPKLPIRRAAFLNSPHRGSMLAYACPIGGIRQIRPTDPFIRRINAAPWEIPTLVSWCPLDTMVIPGRSARLPRASQTIRCAVPMHIWPIHSKSIWRRVVEFISESNSSGLSARLSKSDNR